MRAKILFFILILTIAFAIYINRDWEDFYVDNNPVEQQKRDVVRMNDIKEISNALSKYYDDLAKYPIYYDRWNCISETSEIAKALVWDYLHRLPKDSNTNWNAHLCSDNKWTYYYYPFFYEQKDHFVLCANVEFNASSNEDARDIWNTISKIKKMISEWNENISFNKIKDLKKIWKINKMEYQLYCLFK